MAEIERIAQELRAANKRPLPATEDQVKALLSVAERERPLTLTVDSQAVATLLLGQVEQQAQVFQETGYQLINYLDDRQQVMRAALEQGVAAVQAAEAKLQASAQQIPRSVPLNVFDNWCSTLGFTLGPVALVLVAQMLSGHFSRVPKEELTQVQAELTQARDAVRRFQQRRATLVKVRPELAYKYFPYADDPKPAPAQKQPYPRRKQRGNQN
jgi:hypothetical protein